MGFKSLNKFYLYVKMKFPNKNISIKDIKEFLETKKGKSII